MYILVETNKTTGRKLVVALFSFSETIYIYMYIYIYIQRRDILENNFSYNLTLEIPM